MSEESDEATIAYLLGRVDGMKEQLKLLRKMAEELERRVGDIEKRME